MKEHFFLIFLFTWAQTTSISFCEEINYRLPDSHVPHNYNLKLAVSPDQDEFSGQLMITFDTKTDSNYLFLHASSRITNLTEIKLDYAHDCNVADFNNKTELLNITCDGSFYKGEHKLSMNYISAFGKKGMKDEYFGLYKAPYDTVDGRRTYAVTQFEPTYARNAFPCFDEPKFKAEFEITVLHPYNYTVLANTQITAQVNLEAIVQTKFKKTPPISTYLIALVVSNFEAASDNSNSTPSINVYSTPSQHEHTGTATRYGRSLVAALGKWTGVSYQDLGIPKVDFVAVPQFSSGAMENWGLITFSEYDLLDEGAKTSAADKQNIISVIAHELSHHWFGDYVTLDWWSNTWLNEGFATYFEFYTLDMVDKLNMEMGRQFVPLALHEAFEADGAEAPPLSSPYKDINTPTEDFSKFDGISYSKGGSVIRMMKSILGEDNFQKGLQSYVKTNAYKNANPTDVLNALSKYYNSTDTNFEEIMKNWIYQSGYPIVTASLKKTDNVVTLEQEQFPQNSSKEEKKYWTIPITFKTSKDKGLTSSTIKWLVGNETLEVKIQENSWIVFNLQQTGYYRVNYDDELWNRISLALKSDDMKEIHVSNRAQLLDDAFSLAKIGKLNYSVVFDLASYLGRETEYEPWFVATKSLKYIKAILEIHNDTEALTNLKSVVLKWIDAAFPDEHKKVTKHLDILTKVIINDLKCEMDHSRCLENSKRILMKFIIDNKIADYNTRKTALCFGLKQKPNPENEFNKLLKYYKTSNSAQERRAILQSLGCISDTNVLSKYLSELLATDSVISRTDAIHVYRAVAANNHVGLQVILPFLKTNLKTLLEKYSGLLTLSDLIMQPAKWIVSQKQFSEMKDLIENNKDVDGIDKIGKAALEIPSLCNEWFDKNRKDIDLSLSRLTGSSTVIAPSILVTVLSVIHCIILFKNIF